MPQLLAGAVLFLVEVGIPIGLIDFALKVAAVTLLNILNSKLFGPKIPDMLESLRGVAIMRRSAIEYRKAVYGQAIVSGPIVYNNVAGDNREHLYYVVALADGEISEITSFYIDGDEIPVADVNWTPGNNGADGSGTGNVTTSTFVGNDSATAVRIRWARGHANQVAMTALSGTFSDWTSSHRLRGIAYMAVQLTYNEKTERLWQRGAPQNLRAVVKGRRLYDPRLDSTQTIDPTTSPITTGTGGHRTATESTWAWSDNPALCVADYLVKYMNVDADTGIDWPSFAAAADDCDALVVVPPAASPENTEKRFTCNGVISMGSSHKDNLDNLLSSCDGKLSYTEGQWVMRTSVWEASSVTYDEDDLAGPVEVRGSSPRSERVNSVRGVFVDPDRNYEPTEFPHVTNSTYVTRDNGRTIKYDLELPMTNSATMAQRIAFRLLEQANNQVVLKTTLNARGAKCAIGDVVTLDLPRFGWTAGGNLLLSSEEMNATDWTSVNSNETINATPSPWGSAQADSLNEDGTAATTHYIQQTFSGSDNTVYTFSVYLKAANRDWARIQINTRTGGQRAAYFDLANGQVGSVDTGVISTKMENAGRGWYRCSVTADIGSGGTSELVLIAIAEGDGDVTFDGLSQTSLYAIGAQLVASREPGFYHRTTTAAVNTTPKTFRVVEWQRNSDGRFDVTLREDVSASYDDPIVTDYTTGNSASVTVPSEVVPPPTNLAASSVPYGIKLTWTSPAFNEFDVIDVYASNSNAWSGASRVASVRSDTYTHSIGSGQQRYYWLRARRNNGDVSVRLPNSDTSTVTATSGAGTDSVFLQGATLTDQLVGNAEVGYRLTTGGQEESFEGVPASPTVWDTISTWLLSGAASSYECRLTNVSGTNPTTGTVGTWLALSSTREWIWQDTTAGDGVTSFSGTIEIRDTASPASLLASASLTVTIENQDATITLTGGYFSSFTGAGAAQIDLRIDDDGNVYYQDALSGFVQTATATNWMRPTTGAPSTYSVRFTSLTGDALYASTVAEDVWHPLSSGDFTVSQRDVSPAFGGNSSTMTIEIGDNSSPIQVVASASYTLEADLDST